MERLMPTSDTTPEYPRLRHCTLVTGSDSETITMVVGRDCFELTQGLGKRESLLHVKSYFDGRHSIEDISTLRELV